MWPIVGVCMCVHLMVKLSKIKCWQVEESSQYVSERFIKVMQTQ